MLGSEYPEANDAYTAGSSPYLAAAVFNQIASILENTQRAMGQDLGILSDIGNTTDDTFAKQFKKLLRVDFGVATYTLGSGTEIAAPAGANPPYGTREITVTFNTYGGASVFDDPDKIRVFVTEGGGNLQSQTQGVFGGRRRDVGNVVDGSITTSQFKYRNNSGTTSYPYAAQIGSVLWLAVQWED